MVNDKTKSSSAECNVGDSQAPIASSVDQTISNGPNHPLRNGCSTIFVVNFSVNVKMVF